MTFSILPPLEMPLTVMNTIFIFINYFGNLNQKPDHRTIDGIDHGRIETRKIWLTTELNEYLDFPYVGQIFMIERTTTNKKSGKESNEIAYGITSKTPDLASSSQVLQDNRGHWSIENSCHYIIDWNYDEDRSRIRTGYGPENITRLRRFAISVIKSKEVRSVASHKKCDSLPAMYAWFLTT